jgi:hypothetical protein
MSATALRPKLDPRNTLETRGCVALLRPSGPSCIYTPAVAHGNHRLVPDIYPDDHGGYAFGLDGPTFPLATSAVAAKTRLAR